MNLPEISKTQSLQKENKAIYIVTRTQVNGHSATDRTSAHTFMRTSSVAQQQQAPTTTHFLLHISFTTTLAYTTRNIHLNPTTSPNY